MKLSLDEQEYILDLVQGPGWPHFLQVLERFVDGAERDVLRCQIEDGNVTRLVHTKLRSEGARKLAADVRNLPALVKKQIKE
jgi:hypothetical protein